MAFLDSMNVSASALTANRLWMDTVAQNMANANNTRTESGEPYRRRYVIFEEREAVGGSFSAMLSAAEGGSAGGGVRVADIVEDDSEFLLQYDPNHPDADEDGYVSMPNVDTVQEMVDMMTAYRSYEANITALNTFKDMAVKTLELGR